MWARWLLLGYRWLPHRVLNAGARVVARLERPRWLVRIGLRLWMRAARVDTGANGAAEFASLEHYFSRPLSPNSRPLGAGVVSPADGRVVAAGRIGHAQMLPIKRGWCSADRLVNEQLYGLDLEPYAGGAFVVVYLSPYGYHGVHMPTDGRLLEARWLPGRFFPQNDGALVALPDVYARNERVVLRCLEQYGREYLLVLVAASLVGGIHLCGLDRREWARPRALALDWPVAKGARIGHFGFGSTVVVLLPRGAGRPAVRPGHDVLMGHTVVQRMPLLAEAPVQ